MSELCIDASVVVKLVLQGEAYRVTARRLWRDSTRNGVALIAPPFFASEVDTVIRKRVYDGRLTIADANKAYAGLDLVTVQLVMPPNLRQRARETAELLNQRTVYDSTYAALAELRGCDFWTADKAFYNVAHPVLPFVKHLPDYP
ncbi:type II toxin-antitoxin system VapC family toxin [soil metagenome]